MLLDDTVLIEKVLSGDKRAYAQLVDKYKGSVYALALQYTKNYHDAQDVAQEAFLQAYTKLEQLKDSSKFGSWLYRLTVNTCKMWKRKRQSILSTERNFDPKDGFISNGHFVYHQKEFEQFELREILQKALSTLPPEKKEICVLYFMDNYTYREIAEALNIPIGTVKSRLYGVRQKLRKEIRFMLDEGGVLKHNVGIETIGGVLTSFFEKGTELPASYTTTFTTAEDDQDELYIHMVEGDSDKVSEGRSIKEFVLKDFSIKRKGEVQIEVTFTIEKDGALEVDAVEKPDKVVSIEDKHKPRLVEVAV